MHLKNVPRAKGAKGNISWKYHLMGEYDRSLVAAQKAFDQDPEYKFGFLHKSRVLLSQGNNQ